MSLESDVHGRLGDVRARIAAAAERVGRDPAGIRLVAVSKTFGIRHVRAAAAAGQTEFGENRVQEALQKIGASADLLIKWHLVGHLQSNKIRKAAPVFSCIQSIDSVGLLERLDRAALDAGASPEVLVQVDLAGETTKHGATPAEVGDIVKSAANCRAARLVGLMVLPPFASDPEHARPFFKRLATLKQTLEAEGAAPEMLRELSMGMSHDFEVAVEEGSTMVRIGTAIFGERHV